MPTLLDQVDEFRGALSVRATGGSWPAIMPDYATIRRKLIETPGLAERLPEFVRKCRNEDDFWSHMKKVSPKWEGRREYLRDQFAPALEWLEKPMIQPMSAESLVPDAWEDVQAGWRKALARLRDNDLDGAMTSARALVETVCKHILDELGEPYNDKADLPVLYKLTAKSLTLSPEQHNEDMFKQVLGGCASVVVGLGAIRTKFGDAHGKGKGKGLRPAPRHAELTVNLAGTMANFLVQTWQKVRDERGSGHGGTGPAG